MLMNDQGPEAEGSVCGTPRESQCAGSVKSQGKKVWSRIDEAQKDSKGQET